MSYLKLDHHRYSFEQLKTEPLETLLAGLNLYQQAVIEFSQKWLRGQETFTVFSSGSTGTPKGILLTRTQMQTSARLTGQALNLQAGDKSLVCLATQHIAGLMMLVRGFELGLEMTVIEPSSNPLAQFSTSDHFDFMAVVPLQLQQMLTDSPDKQIILDRSKAILVGGAPVSEALLAQLQAIKGTIYHTYGMTETVTHIALKQLNGPTAGDAFIPLPEVNLGLDSRGCLTIQSAVTNGETLATNDLVTLNPDGSFQWLGRIDHVINSGGVKVQIETVEKALEKLFYHYNEGVFAQRRFFVGPVADSRLGQTVVAVIEGLPFSYEVEGEMRHALRDRLKKYEVPRHFYFVEKLLETPTGKIDRLGNLERLRAVADA
ncbi:MAG: AMP-binding protein [Chloroflexota bacterium]